MGVSIDDIKKLRAETGAGVMDARQALEESQGDMEKAKEWIKRKGLARAEKKADRETGAYFIFSYVHHNGRVAALLKLACETDFVAKNEKFQQLGKELVMQVASMAPESVEEFLKQDYLRDSSKTIEALVKETAGVIGENIKVAEFVRL